MARVRLDADRLHAYLEEVFPNPTNEKDKTLRRRVEDARTWAEYFFDQGQGNQVRDWEGAI